jgi:hypothetical protein
MNTISKLIMALALMAGPVLANAATVLWTLNDATLTDSRTIAGVF